MAGNENTYVEEPGELTEEMGPIITALKEGNIMTRYYSNRKRTPDLRIFMLKLDEFQLVWCRTGKEGGREEGRGKSRTLLSGEASNILIYFRHLFLQWTSERSRKYAVVSGQKISRKTRSYPGN